MCAYLMAYLPIRLSITSKGLLCYIWAECLKILLDAPNLIFYSLSNTLIEYQSTKHN